ncbi:hypothetical protein B0H65DRAFT_445251 [Neurospora tetraspora]|uniref:Uncharacterized protein n=1 Tax=Neurospora tetraspora TaxID=94610 RepID=A0AAE0J8H5_9PEZI|nr:hypothetical protein B0H65DRAFT_445251 [Neurospora tetraspora]
MLCDHTAVNLILGLPPTLAQLGVKGGKEAVLNSLMVEGRSPNRGRQSARQDRQVVMQDNKYTEVPFAPVRRRVVLALVLFCVALQLLNTPLKWQENTTLFGFEATICGDTRSNPTQLQLTPSPGSAMMKRRQVDKRGRVTKLAARWASRGSVWHCQSGGAVYPC